MLKDPNIFVALIGATFTLLGLFIRQIWDWLRHRTALDALEMHAPDGWRLSEIRRTSTSNDDGGGAKDH